jgi:hypothetical protein
VLLISVSLVDCGTANGCCELSPFSSATPNPNALRSLSIERCVSGEGVVLSVTSAILPCKSVGTTVERLEDVMLSLQERHTYRGSTVLTPSADARKVQGM